MLKHLGNLKKSAGLKSIFYKNVTTWSPLATAFNTRPIKKMNFTREDCVNNEIIFVKFF